MIYNEPKYKINNGKKELHFDHYKVEEKGNNFYGVYDMCGILITHRDTFKQASKIAKLLEEAFIEGYNSSYFM